jgi:hypothetical protein
MIKRLLRGYFILFLLFASHHVTAIEATDCAAGPTSTGWYFQMKISTAQLKQIVEQHQAWLETARAAEAQGKPPDFKDTRYADLCGADLSGIDEYVRLVLPMADLRYANLPRLDLSRADLHKARLDGASLENTDLSHADLTQASLVSARLTKADLSEANLQQAQLQGSFLEHARLVGTDLGEARLHGANLDGAVYSPKLHSLPDITGFAFSRFEHAKFQSAPDIGVPHLKELRNAAQKADL